MKTAFAATCLVLSSSLAFCAETGTWLDAVSPLMTSAERRTYLTLKPEAREHFEENFWAEKSITAEEYFSRLQYVDSNYGSTKTGSGANTDPGRVYLSIGPPNRVTRIPSSRIFAPLEIWYYDTVPALNLNTELRLIFFQKNNEGLPKLYSPTLDTVRALLLPQSSTISMFGPNSDISEADIRTNLTVGPAEDEVITAAVGVASGIKRTGNDELIAKISSPDVLLGKPQKTDVESRFFTSRPRLEVIQSVSPYGARQVDLVLNTTVSKQLNLQVLDGAVSICQNQLHVKFQPAQSVQYTHRLDLLPGPYTVIFSVDGKSFPYSVTVPVQAPMGEIVRVNENAGEGRVQKPLVFGGRAFSLSSTGQSFLVTLPTAGEIVWTVRKGLQVISKTKSEVFDIPKSLEPGPYVLEASYGNSSRTSEFVIGKSTADAPEATVLSYNANLAPSLRQAFVGHQWLLRGNLPEARRCLQASLAAGVTKEATVELARAEALAGDWDTARNRVRAVLAREPKDFDALTVLAYIETKLQDYSVAAQLYRQALSIQDSPALRQALAAVQN